MHRHLAAMGLPTSVGFAPAVIWNPTRLTGHMAKDKKVKDGNLTFILVRGIGEAFTTSDVPADELAAFMEGVPAS